MGQSKGSRTGDSKAREAWKIRDTSTLVSVDLSALEIGSVLLLERNRKIQSGIESRVAATVFALLGVKSLVSLVRI